MRTIAPPIAHGRSRPEDGRVVASVRVQSPLAVTIVEGAIGAAKAGLDIVASSLLGAKAELESGELVRALSDWDFGSTEINSSFGWKDHQAHGPSVPDYLIAELRR